MLTEDRALLIARLLAFGVVGLGVLSLLTSFYFMSGTRIVGQTLPANGGTVGPFTIDQPNTVLRVSVRQNVPLPPGYATNRGSWSFIGGEVLDEDEEYLFGFGGELWSETGYDDSRWTEYDNEYSINVTLPEAGVFYIEFLVEAAGDVQLSPIQVAIEKLPGSSIPHFVLGIGLILLGLLMRLVVTNAFQSSLSAVMEDGT